MQSRLGTSLGARQAATADYLARTPRGVTIGESSMSDRKLSQRLDKRLALGKLWRKSWGERLMLAEALFCLSMASVVLTTFSFQRVMHYASMPINRSRMPDEQRYIAVRLVRWAILACSKRVPWSAKCFQQGLAAQIMLRRRGIPSKLFYGAASANDGNLSAHVWVCDGDFNVVGGEHSSQFAILASFPAD